MKGKVKRILLGWLAHFGMIWVLVNLFHIYEYIINTPYTGRTPWEFFVYHTFHDIDTLILMICLFYIEINHQYFFKKRHFFLFVLSSAVVGMVGCATFSIMQHDNNKDIYIDFGQFLIITVYALLYSIIRNYLHQIRYRKDLQLQQSKNELDALKAQINPHFLFNSLNYLYGTALNEKAPATADGIDKLSGMMRYTIIGLHENFVSIKDEFQFMDNYLALQQARLPKKDNIRIDIRTPAVLPDAQIAPLLILPFVENAFKYGISMDEPCFIQIRIEISGNKLVAVIKNRIVKGLVEIKGNNTGIKNTIERLKLLYPHNYDLTQANDGNNHETILQLALNSQQKTS
ncbi:sensor histidine kinase [Sediminibacterium ginsengisoli]|uniref:Histidine kinase n=1 Tax=Sediminibacterium ginsengisoli TaxID=413434 RepID=A0A1T4M9D5_9BACT|nr:histidine kinase [Sediminibacterium ginsengisoli]SJZ63531.1 Histidine kinase [Sediminibacterium ginsengisoli]